MLGITRRSRLFRPAIALLTSLILVLMLAGFVTAAGDGSGTMTVAPASVGTSTTNTFAFVFTNTDNSAFGDNSEVTLAVPAGWTAPTTGAGAGHVSLSANGCTASIASVTGTGPWTITIPQTCPRGSSFTVNYATATAPSAAGVSTFTTSSRNGSNGLTGIAVQPTVTVFGAATKLVFTQQPTNTTAGASITPAVTVAVEDAGNRIVTSSTASIAIAIANNPGGGALSGTTPVNAVAGVATFSNLSINRPGTGYTLSASTSGLTSATSSAFNITAGAAAKLAFTVQPTNTTAGASITPSVVVTIQDALGNTVNSNANVTIAIGTNPGGGTLSGTLTHAAVAGVATFNNLSINRAGTGYTLTATSGVLTGATSNTFNITAGAANKLAFTVQPTNTTAGSSITPSVTVTVQDSLGNTVNSTASITVAIGTNPGGGTLSGTKTVTATAGVATFSNLSINRPGTGYTLSASTSGLTSATSSAFNITAGAAAKLAFTVQPTNTTAGASITPSVVVTIQDALGNTVNSNANVTIAIGTNPGGGTLSGTLTRAAVAGVATFNNLSINRAGTGYMLTATSGVLTGATSNTFNITAGAANKLAFTVQPTTTGPGATITPAVTVLVQDSMNNTVTTSTASITLALRGGPGGANLSGTVTVNAVAGVATFGNLSVDTSGTGYSLRATANHLTRADSNTFTVIAPLTVKMYKVICPNYTVVPANANPDNLDATGGHWRELNTGYSAKPVDPNRDLPSACQLVSGWTYDFLASQGATIPEATYTTGADGTVTAHLNDVELALARTGTGLWVREETQASAGFGSIRCYDDVLNGDNLENIQHVPDSVSTIYCIAYNVAPTSLSISKVANSSGYDHVGQVIGYTYTLTNTGTVALFAPYTVTDNNVDAAPICPAVPASVAPNGTVTCTASRTVTQADLDAGAITNVASGHAKFAAATIDTTINATVTVPAVVRPALNLVKSADVSSFSKIGDVINYTYTVTNTGNVTLVAPFAMSDTNPTVICEPVASLAPGGHYGCTAFAHINQGNIDAGVVGNLAIASGIFQASPVLSNPALVFVPVEGQYPTLDITKTADRSNYNAVGQVIGYTIVLTNTGNVTLANPSVSDPSVSDLNCGLLPTTLAPGAKIDCTASHTVTETDIDDGSVDNTATGNAGFNGTPVSDTASASADATQTPQLSISKIATPTTFDAVGKVIGYTIVLRNDGNVTLSGPSVSDPAVSDLDCGTVPATLAPGAQIHCTASLTTTQADFDAGSIVNTATGHAFLNVVPVSSAPATATATATGRAPSLSITKTASTPTYDHSGQVIGYAIVLTNDGNVTLDNPSVSDPFVVDLDCGIVPATLAPGASINCTASHTVSLANLDAGSVSNTATGDATFGGAPVTDSATVESDAAPHPSLTFSKTSDTTTYSTVGHVIGYTLVLTNNGNVTLANPSVLDPSASDLDCGTIPASLAPGASVNCTASHTVTQADLDGGSVANTASGTAYFGASPLTFTDGVTATASQNPSLSIAKTANPTTYDHVGQVVHFTIVLTNDGNVTLADPAVGDALVGDLDCGTLPASLAPGAHVDCTASYTITQADINKGSVYNTATGSASFGGAPVTVTGGAEAQATLNPSLSIAKTASPTTYNHTGQVIAYTIVLTNNGNVPLSNPAVGDPSVSNLDCGTIPATLAPGAHVDCTASYTVTQDDLDNNRTISNTATGTAMFVTTPITVTDSAQAKAARNTSLAITKTASPTTYDHVGQVIGYTMVLTNDGNVTLTNPAVSDPAVGDLDCGTLPATLAPGATINCTASHTVTQADLDNGSFNNTATGTANDGDATVTVSGSAEASTTIHPELTIHKTSTTTGLLAVGDSIAYTYRLTNTGNVTLAGPFTVDDDKTTVVCPDTTTLDPGAHIDCTATYTVVSADIDAGSVTNLATGHAAFQGKPIDSAQTSLTVGNGVVESPGESVGGVTAPPTSTPSNTPGESGAPFFALLICLAFAALALLAVQVQRSSLRR